MRFEYAERIYEGPDLAGVEGLAVYRDAWAAMVALGFADFNGDERAMLQLRRALPTHPGFPALFDRTFKGWTVDGLPLSWAAVPALYSARLWQLADITLRVWFAAGFFGAVVVLSSDPSPAASSSETKS